MRVFNIPNYNICTPRKSSAPNFKNLDSSDIAIRRLAQKSLTNEIIEKELREMNLI